MTQITFAASQPEAVLTLPAEHYRLEEINLPAPLVASLTGQTVAVQILPEEQAGTRRVDPSESAAWINPETGEYWNDYQPLRILFTDSQGEVWRFPRRWLHGTSPDIPPPDEFIQEAKWRETTSLPTEWDLDEINVPWIETAHTRGRGGVIVEVQAVPGQPVKVWLRGPSGRWRIPNDWRRRRIKLPDYEMLVSQGIPIDVAKEYAHRTVSVNYHPGSLCCLPDAYRFRDSGGNRWPVKIRDCLLLGYGDQEEARA